MISRWIPTVSIIRAGASSTCPTASRPPSPMPSLPPPHPCSFSTRTRPTRWPPARATPGISTITGGAEPAVAGHAGVDRSAGQPRGRRETGQQPGSGGHQPGHRRSVFRKRHSGGRMVQCALGHQHRPNVDVINNVENVYLAALHGNQLSRSRSSATASTSTPSLLTPTTWCRITRWSSAAATELRPIR